MHGADPRSNSTVSVPAPWPTVPAPWLVYHLLLFLISTVSKAGAGGRQGSPRQCFCMAVDVTDNRLNLG